MLTNKNLIKTYKKLSLTDGFYFLSAVDISQRDGIDKETL
jgi:hypothetical protein